MSLRILPLLHKAFKHLLVLKELGTGFEAERFVEVDFVLLSELEYLLVVGLFESLQVLLTRQDNLLLMIVPVALKLADVFLPLFEQLVHLDVVLGQDCAPLFVVLLVP